MRPAGFSIAAKLVFTCGFGLGMLAASALSWNHADEQNVNSGCTARRIEISDEFRHRWRPAVFDAGGAVCVRGNAMEVKHSAEIGIRKPTSSCYVASSFKEGRCEQLSMKRVNY